MRSESRIFNIVATFLFLVAGVYAWWTNNDSGRVEWAGTLALVLSGGLCAMCGLYFGFVTRRIEPRPEDRPNAEIADAAGEVGFFSPGSYYPFGVGLAVFAAGLGLGLRLWWLAGLGLTAVLVATAGLLFEYYTGARRSAE